MIARVAEETARRRVGDRHSPDPHRAGLGSRQTGGHAEERCLAGACRTDHAGDFAGQQGEGKRPEGVARDVAERQREVSHRCGDL